MKAISAIFGTIGAFVRWLIEAVFKLMGYSEDGSRFGSRPRF